MNTFVEPGTEGMVAFFFFFLEEEVEEVRFAVTRTITMIVNKNHKVLIFLIIVLLFLEYSCLVLLLFC